jgi:hypothetical protein
MGKIIIALFAIILISACRQQKIVIRKTHVWENKMVTKKEHDSLLYNHTINFIKNYSPDN